MFKLSIRLLLIFLLTLFIITRTLPVFSQLSTPKLLQQGKELYARGEFEEAIALWEKVTRETDRAHKAIALNYISLAYQKLGKLDRAEESIQEAIALSSALSEAILAQSLNNKGIIELLAGKPEKALDTWAKATGIYQELKDPAGVKGSLINQAQALETLGLYRRTCKTLLQALEIQANCDFSSNNNWETVLQTFLKQSEPQVKFLGLHSLGNILRLLGDLDRSEEILVQTLSIAPSSQTASVTLFNLGKIQQNRYKNYQNLANRTRAIASKKEATKKANLALKEALNYYEKSIVKSQNISSTKLINAQAKLYRLRLFIDARNNLSLLEEQTTPAIETQVEDIINSKIEELPLSRTVIYTQLNFAQSLSKLDRDNLAIEYANRALKQAKQLEDLRGESYALGIIGNIYETEQQYRQAQKFTEQALILGQAIQGDDLTYQWQWQLGRIYKILGDEQKAIASFNAAVNNLNYTRKDLATISSEVQFAFREDVEDIYRSLVDLLLKNSQGNNNNLQQATQVIDSLQITELEDFLNCDFSYKLELSQKQIDSSAAILYPIILEDRVEVIVKFPNSERLNNYRTIVSKQQVKQVLDNWRTELERKYVSPESLSLAKEVYSWTIAPIEKELEDSQVKTLVFAIDSTFRNIPLTALHDGKQYLIEKGYSVAVITSMQLLEPQPLNKLKLNALTFGLSKLQKNAPFHQGFAPLNNVETELEAITANIPSQQYLNQEFTSNSLENLVSSLPFSVIHLATHGQFSSNPSETFLLAWDKKIDISELKAIVEERNKKSSEPIELLVLSACQTASGDSRATLGLAGVAIQSGARSTIASLWDVNDRSTSLLMGLFYQELSGKNITKSEALRRAQVKLLQTPGYKSPYYWSPYILIGNWL